MQNEYWGPIYWKFIHVFSSTYDPTDEIRKKYYKNFIEMLPFFIPCNECSNKVFLYIKKSNLKDVLKTNYSYIDFFVKLHNHVNRENGKNIFFTTNQVINRIRENIF